MRISQTSDVIIISGALQGCVLGPLLSFFSLLFFFFSFLTQAISPRTADLFVDQDTGELAFHFGHGSSEDCISGTNAAKEKKEMQPLLLQAANF